MANENKNTKYIEWAVMLVLFVGLLVLSKKIGFIDDLKVDSKQGKVMMFIGIFVMMHVVLAVHELGHLLTGLFQGFRFDLFVVGFLGIKREDDKIKVYLNKNMGYYGGIAGTSPKDDSPDNPKKFARILLAGPIASVLFAILCLVLCNYVGKPHGLAVYTGGIMSIGIFFATTIPSRTGMFFTDRKRYQRLVSPGKDRDVELAMLSIMGKFSKDNSYKDIDQHQIQILMDDDMPFIKNFGLFNMICWKLENKGEFENELLETLREQSAGMPKSYNAVLEKEIENYKEKYLSQA